MERESMATPIILDVDPGHDDAVAILMAVASPAIDLLAITCVAGNAPLTIPRHGHRQASVNSSCWLRHAGRDRTGAGRNLQKLQAQAIQDCN